MKLVEKAKMDIERFLELSGQIDKTDKLIKETNIMKHFDDFIQGTIPQDTFAKHLQHYAKVMESLHQKQEEAVDQKGAIQQKKKKPRRKKKAKKQDDDAGDEIGT